MILDTYSGKIRKLFSICKKHKLKIRTAESCTGGALAYCMTHLPGSSDFFDQGFVTYSNFAKSSVLHINPDFIEHYGAVSFETSMLMANHIAGDNFISISTTGILGPDSDEKNTKVGVIYIGVNIRNKHFKVKKFFFTGSRQEIHKKSIEASINLSINELT
jgi:nicotinamide-nucleotide amidase